MRMAAANTAPCAEFRKRNAGRKRTLRDTKQANAMIMLLAERWPACFAVYEKRRKPLKVGIAGDIAATVDTAIRPTELRRALCTYCNAIGYLRSFQVGTARLDLAGNEAGIVTADEAEHARRKLDEVLAKRQPKPEPVPQQRRERPAAQERAPRKQQAETKPFVPLTQRSSGRVGFAELRASAARNVRLLRGNQWAESLNEGNKHECQHHQLPPEEVRR